MTNPRCTTFRLGGIGSSATASSNALHGSRSRVAGVDCRAIVKAGIARASRALHRPPLLTSSLISARPEHETRYTSHLRFTVLATPSRLDGCQPRATGQDPDRLHQPQAIGDSGTQQDRMPQLRPPVSLRSNLTHAAKNPNFSRFHLLIPPPSGWIKSAIPSQEAIVARTKCLAVQA